MHGEEKHILTRLPAPPSPCCSPKNAHTPDSLMLTLQPMPSSLFNSSSSSLSPHYSTLLQACHGSPSHFPHLPHTLPSLVFSFSLLPSANALKPLHKHGVLGKQRAMLGNAALALQCFFNICTRMERGEKTKKTNNKKNNLVFFLQQEQVWL